MKDVMEFIKSALILAAVVLILGSCSEQDVKERAAKIEAARKEGYSEGYKEGYERGCRDQYESDFESMTYDTVSIIDIIDRTVSEYGVTPSEAFCILEDRNEYTWSEYKLAQEVAYFVMSQFPGE